MAQMLVPQCKTVTKWSKGKSISERHSKPAIDSTSFTREGEPTPVQPDFANLQKVWATITPSSVDSSAYARSHTTKAPACPQSTVGGWSVDPNAKLPTLGAAMVSSGMPSGVPKGSITVSGPSSGAASNSSMSPQTTSSAGSSVANEPSHSEASATTSVDSSATPTAGAVRLGSQLFDPVMKRFMVASVLLASTILVVRLGTLL